jgi:UDP-N-acetylmuramoyl-tripeptide--D-alanyl-D-alanine ligase
VIDLSMAEVAAAVGGRLDAAPDRQALITGPVVVDSRQAAPGSLFVAIRGERADGAEFAGAAVAAGAVLVVADRPVRVPAVVVDDPVRALGRLASAVLARLPAVRVVGVTGSAGKTTTKDLLDHLLRRLGPTVAPPGSFNNEIGLPLTVLRADPATRFLVLEYSARGVGHIAYLCRIARPEVAVVLNVGSAHVGVFGSREAIARAKSELVQALPADGLAVLNADDRAVLAMATASPARVVTFGRSESADVQAGDVRLDGGRPRFTLVAGGRRAEIRLRLYGEHQVANALAAGAAALQLGLPLPAVADGLSTAVAGSRWRMEVTERRDGVTVVNDAYNANPESMAAALRALVGMAGGRRTWAVLGPMGELGEAADGEHAAAGRLAVRLGVCRLVAVGAEARPVHSAAKSYAAESEGGSDSTWVPDIDAAIRLLRSELQPADVVLVKASRAVGLERVAESLLSDELVRGPAA